MSARRLEVQVVRTARYSLTEEPGLFPGAGLPVGDAAMIPHSATVADDGTRVTEVLLRGHPITPAGTANRDWTLAHAYRILPPGPRYLPGPRHLPAPDKWRSPLESAPAVVRELIRVHCEEHGMAPAPSDSRVVRQWF